MSRLFLFLSKDNAQLSILGLIGLRGGISHGRDQLIDAPPRPPPPPSLTPRLISKAVERREGLKGPIMGEGHTDDQYDICRHCCTLLGWPDLGSFLQFLKFIKWLSSVRNDDLKRFILAPTQKGFFRKRLCHLSFEFIKKNYFVVWNSKTSKKKYF